MDVRIDFVGVWYVSAKLDMDILRTNMSVLNLTPRDTVPSVGDVLPRTLPFSRSNTSIRVFRHALALHEPRARLHPKFYEVRSGARDRSGDIPESDGRCNPNWSRESRWMLAAPVRYTGGGGRRYHRRPGDLVRRQPLGYVSPPCLLGSVSNSNAHAGVDGLMSAPNLICRRRRLRHPRGHTALSRAHPSALDGARVFQDEHRHPVPRRGAQRYRPRPCLAVPRR